MSPELLATLLVGVGGSVGAMARFSLDTAVRAKTRGPVPFGTLTVNLLGSLVAGLVAGATIAWGVDALLAAPIAVGVLGGFTTFSTASFETVKLLQERNWVPALIAGPGMLIAATLLAIAGAAVGMSLH